MKKIVSGIVGLGVMAMPFIPSCSTQNADLQFGSAVTFTHYEEGHSWVISSIRVTTVNEPRNFQGFARLQRRAFVPSGPIWITMATKGLSRGQLPAPGDSKEFQIRALCKRGTWRTTLTVAGVSHSGAVFPKQTYKSDNKRISRCAKAPK